MVDLDELFAFMQEDVRGTNEAQGRPQTSDRDGRPTYKHVAPTRIAIMLSQIGDLSRFAYSDREVAPTHRGFKTTLEEDSAFGHAFLQLLAVAAARGIDIEAGIENAFQTISKREWTEVQAKAKRKGQVACWAAGTTFIEGALVRSPEDISALQARAWTPEAIQMGFQQERLLKGPYILCRRHPTPDDTPLLFSPEFVAVVTEQGGMTCHAANIARETKKPTVVGVGPITWPTGTHIRIHSDGRIERVS